MSFPGLAGTRPRVSPFGNTCPAEIVLAFALMRGSAFFRSIPNLITVGRLILVPVIVATISAQAWVTAFTLFVLAGVSDGVDGYIAKHFDLRTELGAYLDPLADKALLKIGRAHV